MKCIFCSRQDREGSIANPNCFHVEKYMTSCSPETESDTYNKAWFDGKTGGEIKEALADRHGIPLWRVEEIIEVFTLAENNKEMRNLLS